MAEHKEPERGTETPQAEPGTPTPQAGAGPGRGTPPSGSTEPGRNTRPQTGAGPDQGTRPQAGTGQGTPPRASADPGRGAEPPTGAEPGAGAAPPSGAEPSRGVTPPATGPPQGTSPPVGARPAGPGSPTGTPPSADAGQARTAAPGEQAPPGEPPAAEPTVPDVERAAITAELDAKIAELEDRWLRAVADLDNLRKRTFRDIERSRAEERARVAREFLPVLDNLDLALQHADADPASIAEGVRAIREQAVGVLARLGYRRLDEEGVPFDPAQHEAVSTAPDPEAKPGTIVKVLRPGYGDGEHQLRPAMVVVATDAGRDGADGA